MIRKVETGLPTRIIFTKKVGMPSSQLDSMRQSRQADGLQRLATGARQAPIASFEGLPLPLVEPRLETAGLKAHVGPGARANQVRELIGADRGQS
jgi:hypothetical protein